MRDRWTLRKGWVISFLVGALIGPILTNYHGVQVTARSAQAELDRRMVDLQVTICDARARMEVSQPARLDPVARRALAARFATVPGLSDPTAEIEGLCAGKLVR